MKYGVRENFNTGMYQLSQYVSMYVQVSYAFTYEYIHTKINKEIMGQQEYICSQVNNSLRVNRTI